MNIIRLQRFAYSDAVTEMGPAPSSLPDAVTLWKVDIKINENRIHFEYDKAAQDTLSGRTIETYLKGLVDGNIRPHWSPIRARHAPADPKRRMTPFSIHSNEYRYHVLVLSDMNWQFSEEHVPFKVQNGRDHLYLQALSAWALGSNPAEVGEKPPLGASAKVAAFIANAKQDQIENGGFTGVFWTRFNFYLDLQMDFNGSSVLLPITVDPDVGHPGGSEP
jgi:hypothetical protein